MEAQAVQPALGIPERLRHVAPREGLVARGVTVVLEPCVDVRPLGLRQEGRRGGVVGDEVVGG